MKKNTPLNLGKRLASYGALTMAIAGISDATGQITYTDVDPDETLTGTRFLLDLNGDAITDFEISNDGVFSGVTPGTTARIYTSNDVLGMNAGGNYNYPFALEEGEVLDSGASTWITNSNYQTLNWQGCAYTNSQWCDGQVDKYAGLRLNVGGEQFYGWVRMDIPADASSITIKDYAVNTVAGEGILAGEQELVGFEDIAFNNFEHFINNDVLTLKASTALENVVIYNISGQVVLNKALSSLTETVDLSAQATGVYIAKVTIDGAEKSFKISK